MHKHYEVDVDWRDNGLFNTDASMSNDSFLPTPMTNNLHFNISDKRKNNPLVALMLNRTVNVQQKHQAESTDTNLDFHSENRDVERWVWCFPQHCESKCLYFFILSFLFCVSYLSNSNFSDAGNVAQEFLWSTECFNSKLKMLNRPIFLRYAAENVVMLYKCGCRFAVNSLKCAQHGASQVQELIRCISLGR